MSMKDIFKNMTNNASRMSRPMGARKEGGMTMMGNKVPKERYNGRT